MGSGFSKLKKQARQLEAHYGKVREELKSQEVIGSAGAGLVTITLSGDHAMKKIEIKPACVDASDVEALQDLIKAAYDNACKQLSEKQDDSGLQGLI
jgi:DNA-binding YbaB/EbfC family protein